MYIISTSKKDGGIFYELSQKRIYDKQCKYLNNLNKNVIYYKNVKKSRYINKYYKDDTLLNWEKYVYLELNKYTNIKTLPMNTYGILTKIDLNEYTSLRGFLNNGKSEMTENLIYELFSFVYNFGNFSFIHNDVNLDNLYINSKKEICITNFSKSFFDKDTPDKIDIINLYETLKEYINSKYIRKKKIDSLNKITLQFLTNFNLE